MKQKQNILDELNKIGSNNFMLEIREQQEAKRQRDRSLTELSSKVHLATILNQVKKHE